MKARPRRAHTTRLHFYQEWDMYGCHISVKKQKGTPVVIWNRTERRGFPERGRAPCPQRHAHCSRGAALAGLRRGSESGFVARSVV